MRRTAPLTILGLVLACGEMAGPPAQDQGPSIYYTISGVVMDSVLSTPIPGIRVLVGDSVAFADAYGSFVTAQSPGQKVLAIRDTRYEDLTISHHFDRSESVTLTVRGQAPYVTQCAFSRESVSAVIVDLQGRKTVNRRDQSTLVTRTAGMAVSSNAYSWTWNPIDNLTWLTTVPSVGAAPDSVEWRVEDADGYMRPTRCVNRTAGS